MKNFKIIVLLIAGMVILGLIVPLNGYTQSKARIENVDFYPHGNTVIITYDIVKYKSNETFNIWVDVYLESGNKFSPKALTGDFGERVSGGDNKRIIWDMEADQSYLDEDIAIVVLAESEMFSSSDQAVKVEVIEKEKQPKEKQPKVKKNGISVGGALGLSLVFPGLGRRVATGHGAAYLWGVAGYGCLAGSYFMNKSAYNNYEKYKDATTTSERDDLYKKAQNQELYSKIFIGGAIAIWVVDLIVTGVKAGSVRKEKNDQRMSFIANYDPNIKQPLVGFKYRF